MSEEKKENKIIILKCNLRKIAYEGGVVTDLRGKKRILEKKWRIYLTNIDSNELNETVSEFYNPDDKFAPKCSRDLYENGTITCLNLSTNYEIPTRIEGVIDSVENAIGGEDVPCVIKLNLKKDSTIYPVALDVLKNGEEFNPFEGM